MFDVSQHTEHIGSRFFVALIINSADTFIENFQRLFCAVLLKECSTLVVVENDFRRGVVDTFAAEAQHFLLVLMIYSYLKQLQTGLFVVWLYFQNFVHYRCKRIDRHIECRNIIGAKFSQGPICLRLV